MEVNRLLTNRCDRLTRPFGVQMCSSSRPCALVALHMQLEGRPLVLLNFSSWMYITIVMVWIFLIKNLCYNTGGFNHVMRENCKSHVIYSKCLYSKFFPCCLNDECLKFFFPELSRLAKEIMWVTEVWWEVTLHCMLNWPIIKKLQKQFEVE